MDDCRSGSEDPGHQGEGGRGQRHGHRRPQPSEGHEPEPDGPEEELQQTGGRRQQSQQPHQRPREKQYDIHPTPAIILLDRDNSCMDHKDLIS